MLAYWSKVDEKCQIDQDYRARIVKKAMIAYWSKVDKNARYIKTIEQE
jgi:hypothetical protein